MKTADPSFTPPPPPKQVLHWWRAILWLSLGFLTIVVLAWCNVLFNLTHHLFGTQGRDDDIEQTLISTGVIVLLWIFSSYKVYQIVSRLSYLEQFLHVCAWCRKIEHESQWFSVEQLFAKETGVQPSHGMCPECAKKLARRCFAIFQPRRRRKRCRKSRRSPWRSGTFTNFPALVNPSRGIHPADHCTRGKNFRRVTVLGVTSKHSRGTSFLPETARRNEADFAPGLSRPL